MAKKVFFPPKTFDDDLAAFVQLYKDKGWDFSGVETEALLADADLQRTQRAEHDGVELKYVSLHETFIRDQEARYHRFAAALNAARGAFRKDPVISKELARFKRSIRRSRPADAPSKG